MFTNKQKNLATLINVNNKLNKVAPTALQTSARRALSLFICQTYIKCTIIQPSRLSVVLYGRGKYSSVTCDCHCKTVAYLKIQLRRPNWHLSVLKCCVNVFPSASRQLCNGCWRENSMKTSENSIWKNKSASKGRRFAAYPHTQAYGARTTLFFLGRTTILAYPSNMVKRKNQPLIDSDSSSDSGSASDLDSVRFLSQQKMRISFSVGGGVTWRKFTCQ